MGIRSNIAEKVRQIMNERQKSLAELAEEWDIPLSSLKSYASGSSNLRADTIEMLASKSGLTPAELISQLPEEWKRAQATVRAAELFGNLPAVRQAEGIELVLRLVALFSSEPDQDG